MARSSVSGIGRRGRPATAPASKASGRGSAHSASKASSKVSNGLAWVGVVMGRLLSLRSRHRARRATALLLHAGAQKPASRLLHACSRSDGDGLGRHVAAGGGYFTAPPGGREHTGAEPRHGPENSFPGGPSEGVVAGPRAAAPAVQ